jgi:hypothetical protein
MRLASLCALALAAGGCIGQLTELDGSTSGGGDMAGNPPDMAMHQVTFIPDIQADMDKMICSSSACHGSCVASTPMCLVAMPTNASDQMMNYAQVQPRTMGGMNALILQKNLATNTALTHTGGKPFMTTQDPTFVKWLGWISAGAPSGLSGGGGDMAMPPSDGGGGG